MKSEYGVRRSRKYFNTISDIFYNNYDKFNIAYEHHINGKKYIFTHAGVIPEYAIYLYNNINKHDNTLSLNPFIKEELDKIEKQPEPELTNDIISIVYNANFLNTLKNVKLQQYLWKIGYSRGGIDYIGSCIWADICDHLNSKNIYDSDIFKSHNIFQIFGHSYCKSEIITDNFAMLDCKTPFMLDCKTGILKKYNGKYS